MTYHSNYLTKVFSDRSKHLKMAREMIRKSGVKFDTIVVSGISGMMFGSPLSLSMRKDIAIVRKGESTHSNHKIESTKEIGRWIFVDDLICTGETFQRVIKTIQEDTIHSRTHRFVGAYIYVPNYSDVGVFYTAEDFVKEYARSVGSWLPKPIVVTPAMTVSSTVAQPEKIVENKKEETENELVDKPRLSVPVMPLIKGIISYKWPESNDNVWSASNMDTNFSFPRLDKTLSDTFRLTMEKSDKI